MAQCHKGEGGVCQSVTWHFFQKILILMSHHKMTQGGGGGSKITQKSVTYYLNGPLMGCYSPTLGRRREFENLIYLKVTHPPECTHTHTPEGLPRGRMGCVHEGECSTWRKWGFQIPTSLSQGGEYHLFRHVLPFFLSKWSSFLDW
jgi:hypothetical protein